MRVRPRCDSAAGRVLAAAEAAHSRQQAGLVSRGAWGPAVSPLVKSQARHSCLYMQASTRRRTYQPHKERAHGFEDRSEDGAQIACTHDACLSMSAQLQQSRTDMTKNNKIIDHRISYGACKGIWCLAAEFPWLQPSCCDN